MRISDWSSDVCSSDLIVVRRQNEDWKAGAAFPDVGDQPACIEIVNLMIQQYGIEAHSILCAEHSDRSFTIVGENGPPDCPRSQRGDQSALSLLSVDQHQQGREVLSTD